MASTLASALFSITTIFALMLPPFWIDIVFKFKFFERKLFKVEDRFVLNEELEEADEFTALLVILLIFVVFKFISNVYEDVAEL